MSFGRMELHPWATSLSGAESSPADAGIHPAGRTVKIRAGKLPGVADLGCRILALVPCPERTNTPRDQLNSPAAVPPLTPAAPRAGMRAGIAGVVASLTEGDPGALG
jgi:hypothetical protein